MRNLLALAARLSLFGLAALPFAVAQNPKPVIPHAQDRPPNEPRSPAEAVAKMTVPPGFSVEVVAAEPDLVNPVAMCFDERGRIWVTESLEYPRREPGKGRDRVKVFESTKSDGVYDKSSVFAEGLNIPSGIAVGHGGVWVANSPDILYYPIKDDGTAGKPEVVVSGFGRYDTHELPNALTWGPDGWLYGLNGVFNEAVVKQEGREHRFTAACFRIHPKTRKFELFAEGTSNPWGITFNTEGSLFISACVIDHLWHLTESGYYQRQAGAYPADTWILPSIVKHKHQKAAYCGILWYDSDAYPKEFRQTLYMGNIHGGCLNTDVVEAKGSTYFGKPKPDFVTANDAWFMPVAQKVGPDGCVYVLDWYDRYHCYQDANRDPNGIDRLKGRLYRVVHKDSPKANGPIDLARETDAKLIERLSSGNQFFREMSQRVLSERAGETTRKLLAEHVTSAKANRRSKLHALFALVAGGPIEPAFHAELLKHSDATFAAWGVRAAGSQGKIVPELLTQLAGMVSDDRPEVLLQLAIALPKIDGADAVNGWAAILAKAGDDSAIPAIVWQNMKRSLPKSAAKITAALQAKALSPASSAVTGRFIDWYLSHKPGPVSEVFGLIARMNEGPGRDSEAVRRVVRSIADRLISGELKPAETAKLEAALAGDGDASLQGEIRAIAALSGSDKSLAWLLERFADPATALAARAHYAGVAAKLRSPALKKLLPTALSDDKNYPAELRGKLIGDLAAWDDPEVAEILAASYPKLPPELQPRAVEALSQRPDAAKLLLAKVAAKEIPASAMNLTQVRRILAMKDAGLAKQMTAVWGTIRDDRNPQREQIVRKMRDSLRNAKGDPVKGAAVFTTLCAQCHKLHGQGVEVGPDITVNGRSDYEQLLSNVFDPSLVIGAGYSATTVVTTGGRSVSGLVVEDSPQRIVLKVQGGKLETIPAAEIDEKRVSKVSLMPEGIEAQYKPQEIIDLFAFLTLENPGDPKSRRLAGSPSFK